MRGKDRLVKEALWQYSYGNPGRVYSSRWLVAPKETSGGKHKDWSTILVVCSPKSLTYPQRESGKLKKSLKCIISFLCDAHL